MPSSKSFLPVQCQKYVLPVSWGNAGTSALVAPVAVKTSQKNEDAADSGTVSAHPEAALWLLLPHQRCDGGAGVVGGAGVLGSVIHLQLLVKSSKTCRKESILRNMPWFRTTGM